MSIPEYVFRLFAAAFSSVFGWFFRFLVGAEALGLYLAVFTMYCIVRFLIRPLIGEAMADNKAEKFREKRQARRQNPKSGGD